MTIAIGTKSQRKIETVKKIISQLINPENIEILSYKSTSGVSETPWDKETYQGALNRALDCKAHIDSADYFIGIESGLVERYGQIYEEAWACIINSEGEQYFGYSSGLKVPTYITNKMNQLQSLHHKVMNIIDQENGNSNNDDTWGTYSQKTIICDVSLEEAVRNAFIQIIAPQESYYHRK